MIKIVPNVDKEYHGERQDKGGEMTVSELQKYLNTILEIEPDRGDWQVVIIDDVSSQGGHAKVPVQSVNFGFDWDRGSLLIRPVLPMKSKRALKRKENGKILSVPDTIFEQNGEAFKKGQHNRSVQDEK